MKLIHTLCAAVLTVASAAAFAAPSDDVNPLQAGADIPSAALTDLNGNTVNIQNIAAKPTIAIFYRGGWCPYCNQHLQEIQGIEKELIKLGYQIVGISPDKPEGLQKTTQKEKLNYALLSDSRSNGARAFGIAFNAAEEYKPRFGEGIIHMLEGASGEKHHELPIPAVFILNDGKIAYAHADANYSVRLSAKDLLEAAKKAQ